MFWMRAYPLEGKVGGGWALEFESFLGPVKWHRADRRVLFGAQKNSSEMSQGVIYYVCLEKICEKSQFKEKSAN
jgi:hypothetical protein